MTDRLDADLLDSWWDFDDPEGTVARFERALLTSAEPSVAHAELLTQLARAQGLAGRPEVAGKLLDQAELTSAPVVRTRVHLERGRLLNSAGSPEPARDHFRAAADSAGQESFLLVDALHMLAITDPERADRWTGDALAVVSGSAEPRVRRWAGALRNNLGWTLLDRGDAEGALHQFELALEAYRHQGTAFQVHVAQWSIGRTLRALGRIDEALAVQRGLAERDAPDGHVELELAALARLQGREAEAIDHDARAAALLD